ncbi:MAG: tRNA (adenosine(37)-N6)-threonylcarbamoyltransferase complex ATPase subunit type 1 TsaE [Syntrophorhabdaceae bacterium]|nr:tRNA (adenosine(37)-N6)-threonylcarbamoyltransferase complex ATPase subunit type 1 TsaE [Syntrophorhabdaceae bacterium]
MITELVSNSTEDTMEIARSLGKALAPGDVIALTGDLGAGKTCFCKGIGESLRIPAARVVSPTFTIATEYEGVLPLNHIDVYRLDTAMEAVEVGVDEILAATKGICVVEWAEKVEELLPTDSIRVTFVICCDDRRKIVVSTPEQDRFAVFHELTTRFLARG